MSLSLSQFKEQVNPLAVTFAEKEAELSVLRQKFEDMVNAIKLESSDPFAEGVEDESGELEEAYYEEIETVNEVIGDLAYDFGLEWSGSFEVGSNDFWTPSTC